MRSKYNRAAMIPKERTAAGGADTSLYTGRYYPTLSLNPSMMSRELILLLGQPQRV